MIKLWISAWSCLNSLAAFRCSSASWEGCILLTITNIPVAAEKSRVEESLSPRREAPAGATVAAAAMVVAVRVIMLMELRRREFQLSRCWPTLLCIWTRSATACRMTWSSGVRVDSTGMIGIGIGSFKHSSSMSLMDDDDVVLGMPGTEIRRLGSFGRWIAAWVFVLEEGENERRDEKACKEAMGGDKKREEREWEWGEFEFEFGGWVLILNWSGRLPDGGSFIDQIMY